MSGKKRGSAEWTDKDDAPDLSGADLSEAVWHVGGKVVAPDEGIAAMREAARRGRPIGSTKSETKQAVTIRYSPEVLAAFRSLGAGWQARMNDALKEWLREHPPT
ncbi:MAG: BrnA antitoxin family protein [Betaproteobacteria bacterium]|nr:BrnA antitoxin family protein [Betaproteobacteria bacterium]